MQTLTDHAMRPGQSSSLGGGGPHGCIIFCTPTKGWDRCGYGQPEARARRPLVRKGGGPARL